MVAEKDAEFAYMEDNYDDLFWALKAMIKGPEDPAAYYQLDGERKILDELRGIEQTVMRANLTSSQRAELIGMIARKRARIRRTV